MSDVGFAFLVFVGYIGLTLWLVLFVKAGMELEEMLYEIEDKELEEDHGA